MGWLALREGKVLQKTKTKIKVSFTETEVLCFKESFTFQSKCCILKKELCEIESFIYLKESIIINQKVFFLSTISSKESLISSKESLISLRESVMIWNESIVL